jgi:hypothetical protein
LGNLSPSPRKRGIWGFLVEQISLRDQRERIDEVPYWPGNNAVEAFVERTNLRQQTPPPPPSLFSGQAVAFVGFVSVICFFLFFFFFFFNILINYILR